MARNPLFSTYRQGENRVTSSMIAVFQRIDIGVVERLLGAASGESSLAIVTFANQVAGKQGSIPDAAITANCCYLFEVKTTPGAVRRVQLQAHLAQLDGAYKDERLFVITPDATKPTIVDDLSDSRVSWLSFLALSQAIDALLGDPTELISEQGRFLLRELQALFAEDGLLEHRHTVVVAAGRAWGEYLLHSAYICQPNRPFQKGITHLGFYADGEIKPHIARILDRRDQVECSVQTVQALLTSGKPDDRRLGQWLEGILQNQTRPEGAIQQIFLLSSKDDDETVKLAGPIQNTARDHNGRPCAWTQAQRYTRLAVLKRAPKTTGELDAGSG